jgi:hypothetical protein
MPLQPGQQITLRDGAGRAIGLVRVERLEGNVVFGGFTPGPCFATVAPLFADFIASANDQLFSVVAELDEKIAALGLALEGAGAPAIEDVQIGDETISFRVRGEAESAGPTVRVATGESPSVVPDPR